MRKAILLGLALTASVALAACGTPRAGEGASPTADGGPTTAQLMEPGPLGDIALGRDDAPVTIIEYASLTCPYCRQFHLQTYPRLKKELIDTGKVRYIVREFPIGRTAGAAAIVTRCAPREKYMALYEKFLEQQRDWTSQEVRPDALYQVAAQVGMSRSTFDNCLANQSIIEGLKLVKQRGREFGVVGTPTFFVNGTKASGALTFDQIKAMIAPHGS